MNGNERSFSAANEWIGESVVLTAGLVGNHECLGLGDVGVRVNRRMEQLTKAI